MITRIAHFAVSHKAVSQAPFSEAALGSETILVKPLFDFSGFRYGIPAFNQRLPFGHTFV